MRAKIAFISTMSGSQWGGSEELWTEAALYAIESGHQVFISVFDWGKLHSKLTTLKNAGAIIHLRPRSSKSLSGLSRIIHRVKSKVNNEDTLFKPLVDFKPDFICFNQGYIYDFLYQKEILNLLETIKTPYYLIGHINSESGVLTDQDREICTKIFSKAQHIYFVSERNRNTARRQLLLKIENSSIVQNPVNLTDHSLKKWPSDEVTRFTSVARLECNYKGQDILFEVLSTEKWKNRAWKLSLFGTGRDKEYLKALSSYFGLDDKIVFHDFTIDIGEVWLNNHILLMPSIYEGIPLSLVEAMLCGRPAVVTDVGGNSEYIIESQTGFIAEAPSIQSFDAALERAWNRKEEWPAFGERAHAFAKKKYDPTPGKSLIEKMIIENARS